MQERMPGPLDAAEDRDGPADRPDGTLQQVGRYGGHGLTIGAATALFTWLGHLLDGWLHTAPLFVILGAAVGFSSGFYAMYRDLVLRPDEPEGDGARGPSRR